MGLAGVVTGCGFQGSVSILQSRGPSKQRLLGDPSRRSRPGCRRPRAELARGVVVAVLYDPAADMNMSSVCVGCSSAGRSKQPAPSSAVVGRLSSSSCSMVMLRLMQCPWASARLRPPPPSVKRRHRSSCMPKHLYSSSPSVFCLLQGHLSRGSEGTTQPNKSVPESPAIALLLAEQPTHSTLLALPPP